MTLALHKAMIVSQYPQAMGFQRLGLQWLTCAAALIAAMGCGNGSSSPSETSGQGGATDTGGMGGTDASGGGGAAPDPCNTFHTTLDDTLGALDLAANRPGGIVAAVYTPACGAWAGAEGRRDDASPMTPVSLLRIASVTKTYTAAAILRLADDHQLDLDATLDTYLTTGVPNEDSITIRRLLNHTAGVYSYTKDDAWMDERTLSPEVAITPQEMVDVAIAHGADFAPGASWSYSNTGYILLGMVVEAVSGQKLGAYFRDHLLDTQELDRTFFDGEEALPEPIAKGYGPNGEDQTLWVHPSVSWSAGAMVAEVGDMVTWARALYTGNAISDAAREEMFKLLPGAGYGAGVFDNYLMSGERYVGHNGGIAGYGSVMYHFPEQDVTIAMVVNHAQRDAQAAFEVIAQRALTLMPPR